MANGAPDDPTPLAALDANVFDRFGADPDGPIEALRRLVGLGRIRLGVPQGVAAELAHPHAPPASKGMFPAAIPLPRSRRTAAQEIARIRIRAILRGDGRPGKHDADAAHLSDAAEAGCSFFVTGDGKMLRKRDVLAPALPPSLRIVTLAELLSIARDGDMPA